MLSGVLDPVGSGLGKVLSPVGATVNGITKPATGAIGAGLEPVMDTVMAPARKGQQAGQVSKEQNKPYEHYGGKEQNKDNPLGL